MPTTSDVLHARPRRGIRRSALLARAMLLAMLLVFGAETARTLLGSNFHTVTPERCYRSAQPSPDDLRLLVRMLGIRSILNLRGWEDRPWYVEERTAAQRLELKLVDAGMWAARPPTPEELQEIVDAVDRSTEPVLIHCYSGIDRTGIASAIFLLLKTDTRVDEACRQLSPRFGHNPWGKTGCQDRVLAAYAAWLAEQGLSHQPEHFRRWVRTDYRQEPGDDWTVVK